MTEQIYFFLDKESENPIRFPPQAQEFYTTVKLPLFI